MILWEGCYDILEIIIFGNNKYICIFTLTKFQILSKMLSYLSQKLKQKRNCKNIFFHSEKSFNDFSPS